MWNGEVEGGRTQRRSALAVKGIHFSYAREYPFAPFIHYVPTQDNGHASQSTLELPLPCYFGQIPSHASATLLSYCKSPPQYRHDPKLAI